MVEIKEILIKLSIFYNYELTDERLRIYTEFLSRYNLDEIVFACEKYMLTKTNSFFPSPAELINILNRDISNKDKAIEVASRITSAISRFGYTNPTEAREYLGEIGWNVVELQGGWYSLCERVQRDEIPIYQAQWKNLAEAEIFKNESGISGPPRFRSPQKAPYEIENERRNFLLNQYEQIKK